MCTGREVERRASYSLCLYSDERSSKTGWNLKQSNNGNMIIFISTKLVLLSIFKQRC